MYINIGYELGYNDGYTLQNAQKMTLKILHLHMLIFYHSTYNTDHRIISGRVELYLAKLERMNLRKSVLTNFILRPLSLI